MAELKTGATGRAAWAVTEDMTAVACRSGSLPVFATPMLAAVMECAACEAIKDTLPEGSASVGVALDIRHIAASPVGRTVTAEAVLTRMSGRTLIFEITADDDRGPVGSAVHTRVVVDARRFMDKLE